MQDRLAELRRQRALIAEHLAWLDREISAPSGITASSTQAVPPPALPPPLATTAAPTSPPLPDPAAILARATEPKPETPPPAATDAHADLLPEHRPADIKNDVRRGCFLYLALATLAVLLFGGLLIWASRAYKKSHPQPARAAQPAERY